ncbi:MAG: hypothetical protein WAK82_26135 [Streptosporangiaceae bacterium]
MYWSARRARSGPGRCGRRVDGKLQIAEPNTSSSRRTVVLPRFAMHHLQEHKKRQDAERQALGYWFNYAPEMSALQQR